MKGAASGIGLATAEGFLRSNIEGLLLVDKSQELLQTAVSSFTPEDQQRCEILVADVSSEADCTYAERALERWGRLDIAVLNAGICFPTASITETDVEVWDKLMSVNARGVFLGLKHSAKAMLKKSQGSIVIVSSQLGLQGSPGLSAYGASKWAVRGLSLTAAEELTPLGIRVNSVCPGPILTPLIDVFGKDSIPKMEEATLMNRMGKPEEIANAIIYLASDAASFCSGTTLKVDGGYAKFG
ncbi:oxidoreductase [Pholiota molesta]|nr:oxidoreductase [Pholiota molesta]